MRVGNCELNEYLTLTVTSSSHLLKQNASRIGYKCPGSENCVPLQTTGNIFKAVNAL